MNNNFKYITLLIFISILYVPFLQQHFQLVKYQPVDENRYKNKCPDITLNSIFMNHKIFKKEYELFYEDTYGLRDLFIRLKHQIDYTIFKKADRVHIGKKGWLYAKWICDKQVKFERRTQDEMKLYYENTKRLADYIQKKGATLVIVTTPQKNTIYPEYMSSTMPKRPKITFLDKYIAFLDDQPNIIHINSVNILRKLKKDIRVFHKTDFHWNHVAAINISKELVNVLGKQEGLGEIWDIPFEFFEQEVNGGSMARDVQMLFTPKEINLAIKFPDSIKKTWEQLGESNKEQKYYFYIYKANRQNNAGRKMLPTTILYADSCLMGFHVYGAHTYFEKFYNSKKGRDISLQDILKDMPKDCKYFVLQRMEIDILDTFNENFYLPDNV